MMGRAERKKKKKHTEHTVGPSIQLVNRRSRPVMMTREGGGRGQRRKGERDKRGTAVRLRGEGVVGAGGRGKGTSYALPEGKKMMGRAERKKKKTYRKYRRPVALRPRAD